MDLLYKNERPLFIILLTISLLLWAGFVVGTKGIVLGYIFGFFLFYLFAQSALISHLKGTAVEITSAQFPDLHEKIVACAQKLALSEVPEAYLLHAGGVFNAFATRFLGRNFVVLYSDIVDALDEHSDALNFYIGHELGHIKRNHLRWTPLLLPATFLPLVGAAYHRAREYTCDRHGLAACKEADSAQLGLGALAAGGKRWRTLNKERYLAQVTESSGFWMSLHELIADYPWLTKRAAALNALATGAEVRQPGRNPFAWFLALFIPRFGASGAGSALVTVAIIGILAAVAIPAFQEYQTRAKLVGAVQIGHKASNAVAEYFYANNAVPKSLDQAGFISPSNMPGVQSVNVNPTSGVVQVTVDMAPYTGKSIAFIPSLDANKRITWRCASEEIKAALLPPECRQ